MSVWRQLLCTAAACYGCMVVGIMLTWPSSTLTLFQSSSTTLHRPINTAELALFGSLSSIGALISTPLNGFLLDRIGRKYCAVLNSLMHVTAWSMIAVCNNVAVVLTAIFISGLGCGIFLVAPVYVAEFCQESIRGSMTAGGMIFYALGMLVSYVLGGYLDYSTFVYVCLSVCVAGVLMLGVLEESPVYLMQKGLEEEAAKSIAYYRTATINSKEVLEEINAIKRALNPDLGEPLSEDEKKLKPIEAKPKEKLSTMQFLRKSSSTRRALVICIIVCTAATFQGLVVVQVYADPLFSEALPSMSSLVASVTFALLTIVSGIAAAYLSDVLGRKTLMVYASLVTGLCCLFLGCQLHLHFAHNVFTAGALYLYCVVYTVGAGTVPYVLAAEVFLPEIKSFVTTLVIEWLWLCNFVILFIFNPVVEAVGLGAVFYLFSAVCLFSAVFCWVCLPETKGMPVDAIQGLFTKRICMRKHCGGGDGCVCW